MFRPLLTALAFAVVLPAVPAQASSPSNDEPVVFHALGAPSDQYYRVQWGLQQANWQAAWETGATGAGRTVAVLDTGVTPGPELPNVAAGWNVVGDNTDTRDDNGHGTHVAGTIAQATNNGIGVAGVAGQATIVPVKVLDAAGDGTDADIVTGILWAISRKVDVINLSLGGDGDGGTCAAIASAVAQGIVVVAASGNSGAGAVSFPAACPGAIAVGATTADGSVAPYSNRGAQLAITAPGGNMATDANGDGVKDGILQWSVFGGNAGYYLESGTSMAAPHVAGAAALVRQAWPAATPSQVQQVLTATAVDAGVPGRDDAYGAGRLDIAGAVTRARTAAATAAPAPTTTSPSPTTTAPLAPATPTDRIAGASRYATAAAIGTAGWSGQTGGTVYLASGTGFADALAAGALSGRHNGPLLLSDRCSVPAETADALRALGPRRVTVVGGTAAVCDAVLSQVGALTGATPTRLAGADRYTTSVELSRAGWPSGSVTVYLASGTQFSDALGAATQAARANAPLLLTSPSTLPDVVAAELRRLGATDVRVVGGPAAVPEAVVDLVRPVVSTVSRVAGADRYDTAAAGVLRGWADGAETVYLASGATFPDGLAVGPLAAKDASPLLLVPPCDLPSTVADALAALAPQRLVVVGGANAICESVVAKMGYAAASR